MKAIEKFYEYLKYKGIAPTRYEKNFGLSNGYLGLQLKRKGDLGEKVLKNIIENCLDMNPEWLLVENSEMLRINENNTTELINNQQDLINFQREKIEFLEKELKSLKNKKQPAKKLV